MKGMRKIEIKTREQLKAVLLQCDNEDFSNLPLFAVRDPRPTPLSCSVLVWSEWRLELPNGALYVDHNGVDQFVFDEGNY